MVVENVEAFCTELEIDLLVNGNGLAHRCIKGPLPRPAERVARSHCRWIWTPIGSTQQVIRISEGSGGRQVANGIEIRASTTRLRWECL